MKEISVGRYLLSALAIAALGMTDIAAAVQVNSGWSLIGNGRSAVVDVASTFGTKNAPVVGISDGITTVWKWDAVNAKWAFFTPQMDLNQLVAYSTLKGYTVLKSILPGEGYWVNASKTVAIPDPLGQPFLLNKWNLTNSWNLVSTAANITPGQFSASIAPFTATTIWAWDPVTAGWYFYAPSLVTNGTLDSYITSKGYKNFTVPLADGLGFWVNRAAMTGSPTANLPPLDQAKQMFAELRTTMNSWVDASNAGALDAQLARMGDAATGIVVPNSLDLIYRMQAINDGAEMFRKIKAGQAGQFRWVDNPTAGTVSALTWQNSFQWPGMDSLNRMFGNAYYKCKTNDMTGSVTAAQLTSVTCTIFDNAAVTNTFNWTDGTSSTVWQLNKTLVSMNMTERYTKLTFSDAGAGVFNYSAQLMESNTAPAATNTPIGTPFLGSFNKTFGAIGNMLTLTLSGELPSTRAGADKLVVNASVSDSLVAGGASKTVNNVVYAAHKNDMSGSITGLNAQSGTAFSVSMDAGTNLQAYGDDLGNRPQDNVIALDFRGTFTVADLKLNGSLLATSFMNDADGLNYMPTEVTALGTFTDTSAGGAGVILNGTLTAVGNNYGNYRSMQLESATNYKHLAISLTNASLKLPSRPTMGLTLTETYTGPRTSTISGQYTYDNGLVITLSGTHNPMANNLTITNQDGVAATNPSVGNGQITKGTTVLGEIRNGMIYYSDGVFESLK